MKKIIVQLLGLSLVMSFAAHGMSSAEAERGLLKSAKETLDPRDISSFDDFKESKGYQDFKRRHKNAPRLDKLVSNILIVQGKFDRGFVEEGMFGAPRKPAPRKPELEPEKKKEHGSYGVVEE